MFCVYILYSEKLNRYYIGTTDNFQKRFSEHNDSKYEHSFSSKGIPWQSFLIIEELNSEQAYAIEKHIKSMKSKIFIENLKKYPSLIQKLKDKFV